MVQAIISCQASHMNLPFSVGLLHPLLPPTVHSPNSNQRGILKDLWIWSLTFWKPYTGLLPHLERNSSFSQPSGLLIFSLYLKPLSACSPHPSCSRSSLPDSLQSQDFCTCCVLPQILLCLALHQLPNTVLEEATHPTLAPPISKVHSSPSHPCLSSDPPAFISRVLGLQV